MKAYGKLMICGLAALLGSTGCDKSDDDATSYGRMTLGLHDGEAGFFRLRVFRDPPPTSLSGDVVFDTGCVEALSRTYELTNIPVGEDRAIVFEGFTSSGCGVSGLVELGFRGGIDISEGDAPYYFLPVYKAGGITAFPEEINLSAGAAEEVSQCDDNSDCSASLPGSICYKSDGRSWCVPTCSVDSDCQSLHPRGECGPEVASGARYCSLNSPYPLNLSEARVMGHAMAVEGGHVAFIGGSGEPDGNGVMRRTKFLVELFDAGIGQFASAAQGGLSDWPAALSGFAALSSRRAVLVGGVSQLELAFNGSGISLEGDWASAAVDTIVVVEPLAGQATASSLPSARALSTVVPLGESRFLVAGGIDADGDILTDATICEVGSDLAVTCASNFAMNSPRINAAGECLDSTCDQVLIFGGNVEGGTLAETLNLVGDGGADALASDGIETVYNPQLCGMRLVAGSIDPNGPSSLQALDLRVVGTELSTSVVDGSNSLPVLAATSGTTDNCYVFGGLTNVNDPTFSDGVVFIDGSSASDFPAALTRARAGAMAARITDGPLSGMVIVGGGFTFPGDNQAARAVLGAEVLNP